MNTTETILNRKSVRAYIDKLVSTDNLSKIIEAGQWAPNAGGFQISVITNAELRKQINDITLDSMVNSEVAFLRQRASLPDYQPLYEAPVLILLSGPSKAPFSAANTALAAENMLLEATELGLSSCFLVSPTHALNDEKNQAIAQAAGIPKDYSLQCAVIIGHGAAENKFTLGERKLKGTVVYKK